MKQKKALSALTKDCRKRDINSHSILFDGFWQISLFQSYNVKWCVLRFCIIINEITMRFILSLFLLFLIGQPIVWGQNSMARTSIFEEGGEVKSFKDNFKI